MAAAAAAVPVKAAAASLPRRFLLLLLLCGIACSSTAAGRAILETATFECGKPWGPCGSAIPAGANCAQPGFCKKGYFCGWVNNTGEPSRCLPIPDNCGREGNACCPSNTNSPHTKEDDKFNLKPYCTDGSYCFYFAPIKGLNNGDMYAAVKGAYACAKVPTDCGTAEGRPCCPGLYKVATNPAFPDPGMGSICTRQRDSNLFCNYAPVNTSAFSSELLQQGRQPAFNPGTCLANKPDCGQFGKSCCITTAPSAQAGWCGARWGQPGPRGYCAGAQGQQQFIDNKDLLCWPCQSDVSKYPGGKKPWGCD